MMSGVPSRIIVFVSINGSNPTAFNATCAVMGSKFQDAIGTRSRFCASTQDASNKLAGATAIYGSSASRPVPDIYQTEYLLVLGANPRVSHWTLVVTPRDIDAIKDIKSRGGKVVFVNPRLTESSTGERPADRTLCTIYRGGRHARRRASAGSVDTHNLLEAMGLQEAGDRVGRAFSASPMLDSLLGARGLSVEEMRGMPHQTVLFPPGEPGNFFERCLKHSDKKIDCCPAVFTTAGLFDRCDRIFKELADEEPGSLKLITLRTRHMHNSWMANLGRFRQGGQATNPLHICEEDAAARDIHDGDTVRVHNTHGEVIAIVAIDDDLRPGTVALSHGYGHAAAHGLNRASALPGVNCNRLTPSGLASFEPVSHMAWLSAVPVEVEFAGEATAAGGNKATAPVV